MCETEGRLGDLHSNRSVNSLPVYGIHLACRATVNANACRKPILKADICRLGAGLMTVSHSPAVLYRPIADAMAFRISCYDTTRLLRPKTEKEELCC